MKRQLFLNDSDGTLMLGVFPEKPDFDPHNFTSFSNVWLKQEYEKIIKKAKDIAIKIINKDAIFASHRMQKGELYDLPDGWTVEILPARIARIFLILDNYKNLPLSGEIGILVPIKEDNIENISNYYNKKINTYTDKIKQYPKTDTLNCISCDTIINKLYPEHSKDGLARSSDMWEKAVVGEISGGYGSGHDGDIFMIAICDKCVNLCHKLGNLFH